jgi:hypothetical protein
MPFPNVNNNIDKVSMDYFLRGVEAAKVQGAQQGQGAPEGGEVQGAQAPQGAGKLVTQLDVLLMKAAKASTKSLDGKAVKRSFQKLVDDGALDRDSLKLFAKAADTAAKSLKALDKFSGRQLAEAFDAQGRFDAASTKAGKAVAAAVQAQQELSDLLAQLGRKLDSISRHDAQMRQANPQYRGVDAALRNKVDDYRLLCDRRATEINHLAHQMKDFAVHLAANGDNADPNVAAILKAKVDELLPRQALAMHGTADALATVSREVTGKLRPLAEKIDAFRRAPATTIGSQDFLALQGDIRTMKAAVQDIRKNGIAVAGGRMMVAGDILKALEKEVARTEELFETARKDVKRTVLTNYLETVTKLFREEAPYERQQSFTNDRLSEMLRVRDETLQAMETLANAALDPSKAGEDALHPFFNALQQTATRLWNAADMVTVAPGPSAERMNAVIYRCRAIATVVVDFVCTVRRMHEGDRFFTGAEAMGVFNGTVSASSVVEARARGLRDGDVDPANEDANIVSERKLGVGVAGEVWELQRSDGTSVVFKGETESRTGLNKLSAGGGKSYDMDQQTVNLNIASKKAAEALGMGDMIVNYSAGTHKGVFGFFMEKAKGFTAHAFGAGKSSSAPDAGLSAKDIKRLPPEQRRQVKADLMREFNRLQWLDLVTGQNDRHWENYFVHVDRDTRKVTLKGIDNDAGYSQSRTGAVKFAFDQSRTSLFKSQLRILARTIDSRNADAEYDRLLHDPGITTDAQGMITVDASKLADKTIGALLSNIVGTHSFAIPDKIDRETYNSLVALKQGPARQAYLDSIRPRLSAASYAAAVSRLDDTIAHAEELGRKGRIIEANGWADVQEEPLATGKVNVRKQNGQKKRIGGEIAQDVHKLFCPSYFARDKIDKLFR